MNKEFSLESYSFPAPAERSRAEVRAARRSAEEVTDARSAEFHEIRNRLLTYANEYKMAKQRGDEKERASLLRGMQSYGPLLHSYLKEIRSEDKKEEAWLENLEARSPPQLKRLAWELGEEIENYTPLFHEAQAASDHERLERLNREAVPLLKRRLKVQLLRLQHELAQTPFRQGPVFLILSSIISLYWRISYEYGWRRKRIRAQEDIQRFRMADASGNLTVNLYYEKEPVLRIERDSKGGMTLKQIVWKYVEVKGGPRTLQPVLTPMTFETLDDALRSRIKAIASQEEDYHQLIYHDIALEDILESLKRYQNRSDDVPPFLREQITQAIQAVLEGPKGKRGLERKVAGALEREDQEREAMLPYPGPTLGAALSFIESGDFKNAVTKIEDARHWIEARLRDVAKWRGVSARKRDYIYGMIRDRDLREALAGLRERLAKKPLEAEEIEKAIEEFEGLLQTYFRFIVREEEYLFLQRKFQTLTAALRTLKNSLRTSQVQGLKVQIQETLRKLNEFTRARRRAEVRMEKPEEYPLWRTLETFSSVEKFSGEIPTDDGGKLVFTGRLYAGFQYRYVQVPRVHYSIFKMDPGKIGGILNVPIIHLSRKGRQQAIGQVIGNWSSERHSLTDLEFKIKPDWKDYDVLTRISKEIGQHLTEVDQLEGEVDDPKMLVALAKALNAKLPGALREMADLDRWIRQRNFQELSRQLIALLSFDPTLNVFTPKFFGQTQLRKLYQAAGFEKMTLVPFVSKTSLPGRTGSALLYLRSERALQPPRVEEEIEGVKREVPMTSEQIATHAALFESAVKSLRGQWGIFRSDFLRGRILTVGLETDNFNHLQPVNLKTYLKSLGIEIAALDPQVEPAPEQGLFRGVLQEMPFGDDEFDTLIVPGLLEPPFFNRVVKPERINSPEAFYQLIAPEIRRVLKPNGKLLAYLGPSGTGEIEAFVRVFQQTGFLPRRIETPSGIFYLLINQKLTGAPRAEVWSFSDFEKGLEKQTYLSKQEGDRAIDMVFDKPFLEALRVYDRETSDNVMERIERIISRYPKYWEKGDFDEEIGTAPQKRAIRIHLKKAIVINNEEIDAIEISGVLFTQENLGKDFAQMRVVGTDIFFKDLPLEIRKEAGRRFQMGRDGRPTPKKLEFGQLGGHGAVSARRKFFRARNILPERGIRGPVAGGYGIYLKEQKHGPRIEKNGESLGVFVSALRKNEKNRYDSTLQEVLKAFFEDNRNVFLKAKLATEIREAQLLRTVFPRHQIAQYFRRYGEALRFLIDHEIYPHQPHGGNMMIDLSGQRPSIYYDLGGWWISNDPELPSEEQLNLPQKFGYVYYALHAAVSNIHGNLKNPIIARLYQLKIFDPFTEFMNGFFHDQLNNPLYQPEELKFDDAGVSNLARTLFDPRYEHAPQTIPPLYDRRDAPFVPSLLQMLGFEIPSSQQKTSAFSESLMVGDQIRDKGFLNQLYTVQSLEPNGDVVFEGGRRVTASELKLHLAGGRFENVQTSPKRTSEAKPGAEDEVKIRGVIEKWVDGNEVLKPSRFKRGEALKGIVKELSQIKDPFLTSHVNVAFQNARLNFKTRGKGADIAEELNHALVRAEVRKLSGRELRAQVRRLVKARRGGPLLKLLREQAGLSHSDLSKKVGWSSREAARRIENGQWNPSPATLDRILPPLKEYYKKEIPVRISPKEIEQSLRQAFPGVRKRGRPKKYLGPASIEKAFAKRDEKNWKSDATELSRGEHMDHALYAAAQEFGIPLPKKKDAFSRSEARPKEARVEGLERSRAEVRGGLWDDYRPPAQDPAYWKKLEKWQRKEVKTLLRVIAEQQFVTFTIPQLEEVVPPTLKGVYLLIKNHLIPEGYVKDSGSRVRLEGKGKGKKRFIVYTLASRGQEYLQEIQRQKLKTQSFQIDSSQIEQLATRIPEARRRYEGMFETFEGLMVALAYLLEPLAQGDEGMKSRLEEMIRDFLSGKDFSLMNQAIESLAGFTGIETIRQAIEKHRSSPRAEPAPSARSELRRAPASSKRREAPRRRTEVRSSQGAREMRRWVNPHPPDSRRPTDWLAMKGLAKKIQQAEKRIRPYLGPPTPLVEDPGLSQSSGKEVFIKFEGALPTHSFKDRSVSNMVLSYLERLNKPGGWVRRVLRWILRRLFRAFVTQTTGNFGRSLERIMKQINQGIQEGAWAGFSHPLRAVIFASGSIPQNKRDFMIQQAADLRLGFVDYGQARVYALLYYALHFFTSKFLNHATSDAQLGAGTAGLEILDQLRDRYKEKLLHRRVVILTPIAAGGLSLAAIPFQAEKIDARLVAVQNEEHSAMIRTLLSGRIQDNPVPAPERTVSGIDVRRPEREGLRSARAWYAGGLIVDYRSARRGAWQVYRALQQYEGKNGPLSGEDRLRVELASGLGAAALEEAPDFPPLRDADIVVLLASGANIDDDKWQEVLKEDHAPSRAEVRVDFDRVVELAEEYGLLDYSNPYAYTLEFGDLTYWWEAGLTEERLRIEFGTRQTIRNLAAQTHYRVAKPSGRITVGDLSLWAEELRDGIKTEAQIESEFTALAQTQQQTIDYVRTLRARPGAIVEDEPRVRGLANLFHLFAPHAYAWTFTNYDIEWWADWGFTEEELRAKFGARQTVRDIAQETLYRVEDSTGNITAAALSYWADRLVSGELTPEELRQIFSGGIEEDSERSEMRISFSNSQPLTEREKEHLSASLDSALTEVLDQFRSHFSKKSFSPQFGIRISRSGHALILDFKDPKQILPLLETETSYPLFTRLMKRMDIESIDLHFDGPVTLGLGYEALKLRLEKLLFDFLVAEAKKDDHGRTRLLFTYGVKTHFRSPDPPYKHRFLLRSARAEVRASVLSSLDFDGGRFREDLEAYDGKKLAALIPFLQNAVRERAPLPPVSLVSRLSLWTFESLGSWLLLALFQINFLEFLLGPFLFFLAHHLLSGRGVRGKWFEMHYWEKLQWDLKKSPFKALPIKRRAVNLLWKYLEDRDERVRAVAYEILKKLGDKIKDLRDTLELNEARLLSSIDPTRAFDEEIYNGRGGRLVPREHTPFSRAEVRSASPATDFGGLRRNLPKAPAKRERSRAEVRMEPAEIYELHNGVKGFNLGVHRKAILGGLAQIQGYVSDGHYRRAYDELKRILGLFEERVGVRPSDPKANQALTRFREILAAFEREELEKQKGVLNKAVYERVLPQITQAFSEGEGAVFRGGAATIEDLENGSVAVYFQRGERPETYIFKYKAKEKEVSTTEVKPGTSQFALIQVLTREGEPDPKKNYGPDIAALYRKLNPAVSEPVAAPEEKIGPVELPRAGDFIRDLGSGNVLARVMNESEEPRLESFIAKQKAGGGGVEILVLEIQRQANLSRILQAAKLLTRFEFRIAKHQDPKQERGNWIMPNQLSSWVLPPHDRVAIVLAPKPRAEVRVSPQWEKFRLAKDLESMKHNIVLTVDWPKERGYPEWLREHRKTGPDPNVVLESFREKVNQAEEDKSKVLGRRFAKRMGEEDLDAHLLLYSEQLYEDLKLILQKRSMDLFIHRFASVVVAEAWGLQLLRSSGTTRQMLLKPGKELILENNPLFQEHDRFGQILVTPDEPDAVTKNFLLSHAEEIRNIAMFYVAHEFYERQRQWEVFEWAQNKGLYSFNRARSATPSSERKKFQSGGDATERLLQTKGSAQDILADVLRWLTFEYLPIFLKAEPSPIALLFSHFVLTEFQIFKESQGEKGLNPSILLHLRQGWLPPSSFFQSLSQELLGSIQNSIALWEGQNGRRSEVRGGQILFSVRGFLFAALGGWAGVFLIAAGKWILRLQIRELEARLKTLEEELNVLSLRARSDYWAGKLQAFQHHLDQMQPFNQEANRLRKERGRLGRRLREADLPRAEVRSELEDWVEDIEQGRRVKDITGPQAVALLIALLALRRLSGISVEREMEGKGRLRYVYMLRLPYQKIPGTKKIRLLWPIPSNLGPQWFDVERRSLKQSFQRVARAFTRLLPRAVGGTVQIEDFKKRQDGSDGRVTMRFGPQRFPDMIHDLNESVRAQLLVWPSFSVEWQAEKGWYIIESYPPNPNFQTHRAEVRKRLFDAENEGMVINRRAEKFQETQAEESRNPHFRYVVANHGNVLRRDIARRNFLHPDQRNVDLSVGRNDGQGFSTPRRIIAQAHRRLPRNHGVSRPRIQDKVRPQARAWTPQSYVGNNDNTGFSVERDFQRGNNRMGAYPSGTREPANVTYTSVLRSLGEESLPKSLSRSLSWARTWPSSLASLVKRKAIQLLKYLFLAIAKRIFLHSLFIQNLSQSFRGVNRPHPSTHRAEVRERPASPASRKPEARSQKKKQDFLSPFFLPASPFGPSPPRAEVRASSDVEVKDLMADVTTNPQYKTVLLKKGLYSILDDDPEHGGMAIPGVGSNLRSVWERGFGYALSSGLLKLATELPEQFPGISELDELFRRGDVVFLRASDLEKEALLRYTLWEERIHLETFRLAPDLWKRIEHHLLRTKIPWVHEAREQVKAMAGANVGREILTAEILVEFLVIPFSLEKVQQKLGEVFPEDGDRDLLTLLLDISKRTLPSLGEVRFVLQHAKRLNASPQIPDYSKTLLELLRTEQDEKPRAEVRRRKSAQFEKKFAWGGLIGFFESGEALLVVRDRSHEGLEKGPHPSDLTFKPAHPDFKMVHLDFKSVHLFFDAFPAIANVLKALPESFELPSEILENNGELTLAIIFGPALWLVGHRLLLLGNVNLPEEPPAVNLNLSKDIIYINLILSNLILGLRLRAPSRAEVRKRGKLVERRWEFSEPVSFGARSNRQNQLARGVLLSKSPQTEQDYSPSSLSLGFRGGQIPQPAPKINTIEVPSTSLNPEGTSLEIHNDTEETPESRLAIWNRARATNSRLKGSNIVGRSLQTHPNNVKYNNHKNYPDTVYRLYKKRTEPNKSRAEVRMKLAQYESVPLKDIPLSVLGRRGHKLIRVIRFLRGLPLPRLEKAMRLPKSVEAGEEEMIWDQVTTALSEMGRDYSGRKTLSEEGPSALYLYSKRVSAGPPLVTITDERRSLDNAALLIELTIALHIKRLIEEISPASPEPKPEDILLTVYTKGDPPKEIQFHTKFSKRYLNRLTSKLGRKKWAALRKELGVGRAEVRTSSVETIETVRKPKWGTEILRVESHVARKGSNNRSREKNSREARPALISQTQLSSSDAAQGRKTQAIQSSWPMTRATPNFVKGSVYQYTSLAKETPNWAARNEMRRFHTSPPRPKTVTDSLRTFTAQHTSSEKVNGKLIISQDNIYPILRPSKRPSSRAEVRTNSFYGKSLREVVASSASLRIIRDLLNEKSKEFELKGIHRPILMVLDGDKRVGKSYFSRYLAHELGLRIVDLDNYVDQDAEPDEKDWTPLKKRIEELSRDPQVETILIEGYRALDAIGGLGLPFDVKIRLQADDETKERNIRAKEPAYFTDTDVRRQPLVKSRYVVEPEYDLIADNSQEIRPHLVEIGTGERDVIAVGDPLLGHLYALRSFGLLLQSFLKHLKAPAPAEEALRVLEITESALKTLRKRGAEGIVDYGDLLPTNEERWAALSYYFYGEVFDRETLSRKIDEDRQRSLEILDQSREVFSFVEGFIYLTQGLSHVEAGALATLDWSALDLESVRDQMLLKRAFDIALKNIPAVREREVRAPPPRIEVLSLPTSLARYMQFLAVTEKKRDTFLRLLRKALERMGSLWGEGSIWFDREGNVPFRVTGTDSGLHLELSENASLIPTHEIRDKNDRRLLYLKSLLDIYGLFLKHAHGIRSELESIFSQISELLSPSLGDDELEPLTQRLLDTFIVTTDLYLTESSLPPSPPEKGRRAEVRRESFERRIVTRRPGEFQTRWPIIYRFAANEMENVFNAEDIRDLGDLFDKLVKMPEASAAPDLDAFRGISQELQAALSRALAPQDFLNADSVGLLVKLETFKRLGPALAALQHYHPHLRVAVIGEGTPDEIALERQIAQRLNPRFFVSETAPAALMNLRRKVASVEGIGLDPRTLLLLHQWMPGFINRPESEFAGLALSLGLEKILREFTAEFTRALESAA